MFDVVLCCGMFVIDVSGLAYDGDLVLAFFDCCFVT